MSLPKPPKETIYYLSNGKTVCFDHHMRRCDRCCMDFTFGESDEEGPYGPFELNDRGSNQSLRAGTAENEENRVFILGGGVQRFIPQWDDQILAPRNTFQIKKDYQNPPKPLPLSSIHTYHCTTCQLTWLIGEVGEAAARSHPSHHTYSHEYAGTSRSLVVFTDGACSPNGTPGARAGLGVYFGPDSKYNLSERLTIPGIPTNQKAELTAVARAMEIVRSKIVPARRTMVTQAQGGRDPRAVSDVMGLRLIIVTDSSFVVEGMCQHFSNWKENKNGTLVNKAGKAVENSEGFLRLKREVEKLSMVGVQVVYYHVLREEIPEADKLAKGSIAAATEPSFYHEDFHYSSSAPFPLAPKFNRTYQNPALTHKQDN